MLVSRTRGAKSYQETAISQLCATAEIRRFSNSAMLDWTLTNNNRHSTQMHYAHRYVEHWTAHLGRCTNPHPQKQLFDRSSGSRASAFLYHAARCDIIRIKKQQGEPP